MTGAPSTVFAFMDEPSTAELSISGKKLAPMPKDYTGISFEEPQLYNPADPTGTGAAIPARADSADQIKTLK